MADSSLPKASDFVSPDYRARCLEWAMQLSARNHKTPDQVIADAKVFYEYVYGRGK